MKKHRKHYTLEEKIAILRRHLVEGVPISAASARRDALDDSDVCFHTTKRARISAARGAMRRSKPEFPL